MRLKGDSLGLAADLYNSLVKYDWPRLGNLTRKTQVGNTWLLIFESGYGLVYGNCSRELQEQLQNLSTGAAVSPLLKMKAHTLQPVEPPATKVEKARVTYDYELEQNVALLEYVLLGQHLRISSSQQDSSGRRLFMLLGIPDLPGYYKGLHMELLSAFIDQKGNVVTDPNGMTGELYQGDAAFVCSFSTDDRGNIYLEL